MRLPGDGKRLARSALRISFATALLLLLLIGSLKVVVTQPTFETFPLVVETEASPEALRRHVAYLTQSVFPRNSDHPENLDGAARYIAKHFAASGARVSEQVFEARGNTYRNVVASLGPESGARIVVGAHYDVFGELPGADDNASGIAGLLELARILGRLSLGTRVDLVAYALEEPPFFGSPEMGSAVHARSLREADRPVTAMICLEMIGYFSEQQSWSNWLLAVLYPNKGDFVMLVGRWKDRALTRRIKKAMRGSSDIPCYSFSGPRLPGLDASDHRNYWDQGYDAVLLTDTAFVRNHNYHTQADTADTLDYERMAGVVEGLIGAILSLQDFQPE